MYKTIDILEPSKIQIQLFRPSTKECSDPVDFTFLPLLNQNILSEVLSRDSALNQNEIVGTSSESHENYDEDESTIDNFSLPSFIDLLRSLSNESDSSLVDNFHSSPLADVATRTESSSFERMSENEELFVDFFTTE